MEISRQKTCLFSPFQSLGSFSNQSAFIQFFKIKHFDEFPFVSSFSLSLFLFDEFIDFVRTSSSPLTPSSIDYLIFLEANRLFFRSSLSLFSVWKNKKRNVKTFDRTFCAEFSFLSFVFFSFEQILVVRKEEKWNFTSIRTVLSCFPTNRNRSLRARLSFDEFLLISANRRRLFFSFQRKNQKFLPIHFKSYFSVLTEFVRLTDKELEFYRKMQFSEA